VPDARIDNLLRDLAKRLTEIIETAAPDKPIQTYSLQQSEAALLSVVQFLDSMQPFRGDSPGRGLTRPLWDLLVAIDSVAQGIAHPLLVARKTGKRAKTSEQQALMGWAAIVLDCLIKNNTKLKKASEDVASELRGVRLTHGSRVGAPTDVTVRGWRNKLSEGAGSAPDSALFLWRKYERERQERPGVTPEAWVAWSYEYLKALVHDRLILQSPPKKVDD